MRWTRRFAVVQRQGRRKLRVESRGAGRCGDAQSARYCIPVTVSTTVPLYVPGVWLSGGLIDAPSQTYTVVPRREAGMDWEVWGSKLVPVAGLFVVLRRPSLVPKVMGIAVPGPVSVVGSVSWKVPPMRKVPLKVHWAALTLVLFTLVVVPDVMVPKARFRSVETCAAAGSLQARSAETAMKAGRHFTAV